MNQKVNLLLASSDGKSLQNSAGSRCRTWLKMMLRDTDGWDDMTVRLPDCILSDPCLWTCQTSWNLADGDDDGAD